MVYNTVNGELEATVKALGGSIKWLNKEHTKAEVTYSNQDNGKKEKVVYDLNQGGQDFSYTDGKMYVKVRTATQKSGLEDTLSWWSDSGGKTNVLIQPQIKNAPVQVTRRLLKKRLIFLRKKPKSSCKIDICQNM